MRLLLHICCANCGLFPISNLAKRGFQLKGLWFNPNIQPEDEYDRRLGALRHLHDLWGLDIHYAQNPAPGSFRRAVESHGGLRCEACYSMRLEETARQAKSMGLDGFSTTLLVSPYQRFDLIVETGLRMGRRYSVRFLAEDFRAGWKEGLRMSRELGLYRQNYCGCMYSKMERQERKKAGKTKAGVA